MYRALYRRCRPARFGEIVGQDHISLTLQNEVITNQVSHAYLLTGSRGIGKTTTARILAKVLNCEMPKNGEPCCECRVCRGIDEGNVPDVQEIDAASSTGVDSIRALREDAQFAPVVGKRRVYIIDEAHMLSIGAFNALLKIMEEPPEGVIFILATTQIDKIPATILSRCQRFDFLRPSVQVMKEHIIKIASEEGIAINSEAANLISILSDSGMRDAISLLDVCAGASNGEIIDVELVEKAAAVPLDSVCLDLLELATDGKLEEALKLVNDCYFRSMNMASMCESLLRICRNLLMIRICKKEYDLVELMPKDLKKTQYLAERLMEDQVTEVLELVKEANEKITRATNPKLELEFCVLKLCKVKSRPLSKSCDEVASSEIDAWGKIIENLAENFPNISGTLFNSKAYLEDDIVLIDSRNSLFLDLIRKDFKAKEAIKQAIYEVLGKRYRIGPYKKLIK